MYGLSLAALTLRYSAAKFSPGCRQLCCETMAGSSARTRPAARVVSKVAEGEGFEPPVRLRAQRFSSSVQFVPTRHAASRFVPKKANARTVLYRPVTSCHAGLVVKRRSNA